MRAEGRLASATGHGLRFTTHHTTHQLLWQPSWKRPGRRVLPFLSTSIPPTTLPGTGMLSSEESGRGEQHIELTVALLLALRMRETDGPRVVNETRGFVGNARARAPGTHGGIVERLGCSEDRRPARGRAAAMSRPLMEPLPVVELSRASLRMCPAVFGFALLH